MGIVYEKQIQEDFTHFSVRQGCTIGGSMHRPSVCYPIPTGLEGTIASMESKGLAKRYTQEMRFVSGVPRYARG